ncbi:MAG: hypothetical protein IPK97_07195 [Ahniella sp.]|nr:hypothetical protein [Ahniella sp.]
MTALVLLLSSEPEPRAAAEARVRSWLHGIESPARPQRLYHVDQATLIWQTGPAIVRHQAEPDTLVFELDSEGAAGPVADRPAAHGLRLKRQASGAWSLFRAWHAERNWYWAKHGGVLAAATSPRLVLAALNLPVVENETAVAAFFGLRPSSPPACFFAGVTALASGQTLELAADGSTSTVVPAEDYRPEPIAAGSDADWQQQFEVRLLAATRDAVGSGPAGLMLSGGLDSTTLAAALAASGLPARLYSWVLSAEPSADESAYARATAQALGLPLEWVPVDQLPFADLDRLPIHPDAPLANPYRAMNDAVMHVAAGQGVQTLLSGNFGDHFYPEPHTAISSAWRHHRPDLAARHLWTKSAAAPASGLASSRTHRQAGNPCPLCLVAAAGVARTAVGVAEGGRSEPLTRLVWPGSPSGCRGRLVVRRAPRAGHAVPLSSPGDDRPVAGPAGASVGTAGGPQMADPAMAVDAGAGTGLAAPQIRKSGALVLAGITRTSGRRGCVPVPVRNNMANFHERVGG